MEFIRSIAFLLVVAVPIALIGLLVVGGGDREYSHERMVHIDVPRAKVYEWLVDPTHRKTWKTGLVSSRSVELSTLDRETELIEVYEVDGVREERRVEILKNEVGERVSFRTHVDGAELVVHYTTGRFHTGRACLLDVRYEINWDSRLTCVTEPMLAWRLRSHAAEELEALRVAMETAIIPR